MSIQGAPDSVIIQLFARLKKINAEAITNAENAQSIGMLTNEQLETLGTQISEGMKTKGGYTSLCHNIHEGWGNVIFLSGL